MKFTNYFSITRERDDRKNIKSEWIEFVFYNPVYEVIQSDGRIKRWAYIDDVYRYLSIIILENNLTIHNAFFDRNFKI
jgi:limonene-1,2-epoxide hydrolase